jgi:erythromycin esterase-like protein/predicted phosphoribosyltransferase
MFMRFRDRADAGAQVALRLNHYARRSDAIVLALTASGLPIAHEVAHRLELPLAMLPAAVIDVPGRPGVPMGALVHGGVEVLDERAIERLGIPRALVRQEAARARLALDRRAELIALAPIPSVQQHSVLLVDDALVVAAVAEAAIMTVGRMGAGTIAVAAPVGRKDVCERLGELAREVVCLAPLGPEDPVSARFESFPQIADPDLPQYVRPSDRVPPALEPHQALRGGVQRLTGNWFDYDELLDGIGDARVVLLGEATHGTHEFYRERAIITRRLIQEKQFAAVAVEADWPDAYRVNRYVRGTGADDEAVAALDGFRRFPTWMWRNADVLDFVGWLRARNDHRPPERRVGFYGLDLYSLRASIEAVLEYLGKVDPEGAARARRRYGCFDRFEGEMQSYAYATGSGLEPSCERAVVDQLLELHRARAEYASRDGRIAPDEYFFAEQNARLVRNAEQYYRTMLAGRAESWNLRDRHMAGTLQELLTFLERTVPNPRVVVWAHNSHIGDARATEMGHLGELNLGQLAREQFGGRAVLVGFTTSTGTVTAASDWDGPAQRKTVRPPLPGSIERMFHEVEIPRFLVPLRSDPALARLLDPPRLERAIGVLYLPATERASHYFHARLASQFDYVLHFDETRAVEPLERTAEWESGELAETYPTGL